MKKIIFTLLLLIAFVLVGCSEEISLPNEVLEILKSGEIVEELAVMSGDEFQLTTNLDGVEVEWKSSDSSVLSIDKEGNAKVLNKGTVVVSATLANAEFVTDSIFVTAKNPVLQTGVGSGASKDDPIFLGNEGEDEPLEIYFLEMQHIYGDSLFIKKGNVEILIDAGWEYDGAFVNDFVLEHCEDKRLDLLMFSHSDGDHVDGSLEAIKGIEDISLMIDYGGVGIGNVLQIRNTFTKKGMVYHSAYDCANELNGANKIYYLTEDFYFEILNTHNYIENTGSKAGNAYSVAMIFYYKDFTFFTAGDLTTASEAKLLQHEELPEVTLYKASHHGSNGSNSQELLNALNPKAVAISASRANSFNSTPTGPQEGKTNNLDGTGGHPYQNAIERIYKAPNISQNLNVYWNMVNGTMKFTTYGEDDFTFQGSPTLKGYYDLTLTDGVAVWNSTINDFENKVTGEENFKLHESKVFKFRGYAQYLPQWAKDKYFPA
jgi:beta-lactamase superfamily II metal-dependent hydrolase